MKLTAMTTPTLLAYINTLELMSTNYFNMVEHKIKPALQAGDITRHYAEETTAKCEKAFNDIQVAVAKCEHELGERMKKQFKLTCTPKAFGQMVDGFHRELEATAAKVKERQVDQGKVLEIAKGLDLDIPNSDKVIK